MRKGEKELPRLIKQWTSSKRYKVIDLFRYFVIIIFSLIIKHFFLKIFVIKILFIIIWVAKYLGL